MSRRQLLYCPFCPFESAAELCLVQHVEDSHPEDSTTPVTDRECPGKGSQVNIFQNEGRNDRADYIKCFCDEFCLLRDLDSHLEMHSSEWTVIEDADANADGNEKALGSTLIIEGGDALEYSDIILKQHKRANLGPPSHHVSISRLGKIELGPHADEAQMPSWLRNLLEKGAKVTVVNQIGVDGQLLRHEYAANEYRGIIHVLSQLCYQDDSVVRAYLCHPSVTHVVKMNREGGFCGYRNIQMLISHIQETRSRGYEHFRGRIPTILQLQDMIERAWDMGFCEFGRVETGGIRGTRKYIGTPEAQALFESLSIPCCAEVIDDSGMVAAHNRMLSLIEHYFQQGGSGSSKVEKVCNTSLPPLYLQRTGHSLTVVGLERRQSGACNLLVFDPVFQPSPAIRRLLRTSFQTSKAAELLNAYRRGESQLQRIKIFEILKLTCDTFS